MDADADANDEVVIDAPPFIRVYKSGRIERLVGTEVLPAGLDPATGVASKDVLIPVLVYYHGGGFVIETAFSPTYHNYLNSLVAAAGVVAVSVDYRRAPEHPLPAAYDDSWAALRWVASRPTEEAWLSERGDLGRVFLAGDSAGANIVHQMALRAAEDGLGGGDTEIRGLLLVHPFFCGAEPLESESWDPKAREWVERFLAALPCRRVLVTVAEKDMLREKGREYQEALKRSGWDGEAELLETVGENHVFHLVDPKSDKALAKLQARDRCWDQFDESAATNYKSNIVGFIFHQTASLLPEKMVRPFTKLLANQSIPSYRLLLIILLTSLGRIQHIVDGVELSTAGIAGYLTMDSYICDTLSSLPQLSFSTVPASVDPATGVSSKDRRIPVLVYYHGGAFCIGNPFMPMFHNYLNSLVARAHVVAVSVNYRLAPEHPIPAAYDDSWKALRWVASHANGGPGPDRWLADHADFDRLFLAGDSAGANIAHHMAMRAGAEGLERGVGVHGVRFWELACPTAAAGVDDPMINPLADGAPSLVSMDRKRVLVCVGVEDVLRDRGRAYYHRLREKRCGEVELYETDGKGHTFHFFDPTCDEALAQDRAICCFLDRERMRESAIE
ncbi:unnamed protein product [Musa acuminata var. zebrina]